MNQIAKVLFVGSKRLGLRCLSTMYLLSPEVLIGIITIDDRSDTRSVFDEYLAFSSRANLDLMIVKGRKELGEILY